MTKTAEKATNSTVQEQLLDAIERCFDRFGVRKTTLADVAGEAGVSRTTVYRYFADRQALIDEVLLRNIERQWVTISRKVQGALTLDEWLLESMLVFQQRYKQDDVVQLYIRADGMAEGLQIALSKRGLDVVIQYFDPLFIDAEREGRLAHGVTREDIAEWVHRTNHSLLAHPGRVTKCEHDLRRWLSAQIHGGLVQLS